MPSVKVLQDKAAEGVGTLSEAYALLIPQQLRCGGLWAVFYCRVVWVNTIRGETPYGGAVAKTVPNLALKPTVMVGKIDVIMAAISLRRCSCLCVYEVRNSKFRNVHCDIFGF